MFTLMPEQAICLFGLFLWSYKMTQRELDREIAGQTGESYPNHQKHGLQPTSRNDPSRRAPKTAHG